MSYYTNFKTAMFGASRSQVLAVAHCLKSQHSSVYKPVIEVFDSLEDARTYIIQATDYYINRQVLNQGETLQLEEVVYAQVPYKPLFKTDLGTLREPLTFSNVFKATKDWLPVVAPKFVHRDADGKVLEPVPPESRVYHVGGLGFIPICQPHEVYWCSTWM